MARYAFFLAVLLALVTPAGVDRLAAQVPESIRVDETVWEVRLADGSTVFGRVVEIGEERIVLLSEGGTRVDVQREQVRSMTAFRGVLRDGEVWPEDTNVSRLFFGPTGRMMRGGEGYIAAYELFLPFVSYSMTDWFTIAGGTPLVPEAIGEIFYLAPKLGLYQQSNAAVAAGILAFFSTSTDFESVGIAYSAATLGPAERSVSFGIGYPFATGDGDLADQPVFMAGGEARLSARLKLVSENYVVAVDGQGPTGTETRGAGIVSGGVRFIGDRLSADLGLGIPYDGSDTICCIPLVNFVYHFGGSP